MMRTSSPGEQIERYTIDRKLTEGGMAEVYLAHRAVAGFDKPVVIKSLLPGFVDNREFVAMMLNEARIAQSLKHPNIVRVDDLIEVGGRPFIVMEYLDGKDLREIVHRALTLHRTLSLAFVCGAVAKMLSALEHAHELTAADGRPLGLVHRDVSLSNVIVTWSGRVKLIDFGIAKATTLVDQDLTRAGQLKGKSAYMSPEQVRREPLDRRSDLFSVGIVLWEMLTQRRLFARRSEVDSMMAICCQDSAPPSSIAPELPPALDRVCAKALARDRAARYETAREMREDLEAVIAAEGLRAAAEDLEAELGMLFPFESAADGAGEPLPALYGDEEDKPTILTPNLFLAEDTPASPKAPRPVTLPESTGTSGTLRSTDLSLFNQRLPGPSVYDDWVVDGSAGVGRRHVSGRVAVLLCCLAIVAMVALLQGVGR